MSEFQTKTITKKKSDKKAEQTAENHGVVSEEKKRKLKELDDFIEGVLQEAGEEFLDEFKQIEGE